MRASRCRSSRPCAGMGESECGRLRVHAGRGRGGSLEEVAVGAAVCAAQAEPLRPRLRPQHDDASLEPVDAHAAAAAAAAAAAVAGSAFRGRQLLAGGIGREAGHRDAAPREVGEPWREVRQVRHALLGERGDLPLRRGERRPAGGVLAAPDGVAESRHRVAE